MVNCDLKYIYHDRIDMNIEYCKEYQVEGKQTSRYNLIVHSRRLYLYSYSYVQITLQE